MHLEVNERGRESHENRRRDGVGMEGGGLCSLCEWVRGEETGMVAGDGGYR